MRLRLIRFSHGSKDTLGYLCLGQKFECFTLEDERRRVKVYGKTCIPDGDYRLRLRTTGGRHWRELKRYGPEWHHGMIELCDVRGFTDILIHPGNRSAHTSGCILVGDSLQTNREDEGWLGWSRKAYERLYPVVADELLAGNFCEISVFSD